jgi:hypothetical protein
MRLLVILKLLMARSWIENLDPTIVSYKTTSSLACFENKNILFYFEKR